jgi:hypothetical protein
MKSRAITLFVMLMICSNGFVAQKASEPPKPGPDVAKLGYFVGDWKINAQLILNRSTAPARFTGTAHNEWMAGGFFLISHSDQDSENQIGKSLTIYGYDPVAKTYSYYAVNSAGQIEQAKGRVEDKIWYWENEHKLGNTVLRGRFVIEMVSSSSYKFRYETASAPGSWSTIMEGTATRTK